MENRTFEFRCFTRRSFISLMILICYFGSSPWLSHVFIFL